MMKLVTAILKPFRIDDVRNALGEVGVQGPGAVVIPIWCGVATFILLKLVSAVIPLRVTGDEETEGLDLVSHEERGYDI